MREIVRRQQQKAGSRNCALEAGLQGAIGTEGADHCRGEGDTCKEYSSRAVPDGAIDASRNQSHNGVTAPDSDRSSDNPGP